MRARFMYMATLAALGGPQRPPGPNRPSKSTPCQDPGSAGEERGCGQRGSPQKPTLLGPLLEKPATMGSEARAQMPGYMCSTGSPSPRRNAGLKRQAEQESQRRRKEKQECGRVGHRTDRVGSRRNCGGECPARAASAGARRQDRPELRRICRLLSPPGSPRPHTAPTSAQLYSVNSSQLEAQMPGAVHRSLPQGIGNTEPLASH